MDQEQAGMLAGLPLWTLPGAQSLQAAVQVCGCWRPSVEVISDRASCVYVLDFFFPQHLHESTVVFRSHAQEAQKVSAIQAYPPPVTPQRTRKSQGQIALRHTTQLL